MTKQDRCDWRKWAETAARSTFPEVADAGEVVLALLGELEERESEAAALRKRVAELEAK